MSRQKSGITNNEEGEDSEESEEEDEEYDDETTNRQQSLISKPTGLKLKHHRAYGGGALGLESDDEEEQTVTRSHTHMGAIKPVQAKV